MLKLKNTELNTGRLKISVICIFSFIMSLLPIGFDLHAQETTSLGLSAAPQIFELDVFPGEIVKNKIIVGNLSQVPIPISVNTTDFTADENSGEMQFDESSDDPIIASRKWFVIENQNFILEVGERRNVNFEIQIPKDAEPGGHYSVMFFEPQLPSYYFQSGQPKSIPVIGVLFLISVENISLEPQETQTPIEITEFKIPDNEKMKNIEKILASVFQISSETIAADINISEKTPSSFSLSIKNNDIFHHKLQGNIFIYNFWGQKVGEGEIKKTTVLPGKTRQFSVNILPQIPKLIKWLPTSISEFLTENAAFGKYRAVLELGDEKSTIELNKGFSFWSFSWKFWLSLIFLVIFTLTLLLKSKKRIKSAFLVLFSKS
jgi:hypothetical protein